MIRPRLLTLALLVGCAPGGEFAEDPAITNHVDDWRDEVIYQLITDRFANGDPSNDWGVTRAGDDLARFHGGDWQGIIDKAGYLQALGVTAVWISPVVLNVEEDAGVAGYHGYWTQDFERPNPHMGDLARLRELVQVMHDHGIKVIVDIVANHIGQLFYYDINQNGQPDLQVWYSTDGSDQLDLVTEWDPAWDPRGIQSVTSLGEAGPSPIQWVHMPELNRVPPQPPEFQNLDWYTKKGRVTNWADLEQVAEGDFPGGLKDLETANPNVRRALIRVFQDWITRTNIDGYRIDTVKHVEHDFWVEFCGAIREHAAGLGKENFLLFGEVFDGDDALVGSYTQDGMLDGAVDFAAKYQVYEDVFKRGAPAAQVAALHAARQANWGAAPQPGGVGVAPKDLPLGFLDNHDVARFLWNEPDDSALRLALVHLLLRDGVPILYYGTEQGFNGGNDPANREPLWTSGYDEQHPLFDWIAELNALRAEHDALRRGDLTYTWASAHTGDEEDAGMLAWTRTLPPEQGGGGALIVVNTHPTRTSRTALDGAAMAVPFAPGTVLVDALPSDVSRSVSVSAAGDVVVELGPREAAVFVGG
jgi:glycosidase